MVPLNRCIIVHPHSRHSKVDIKPPKGDCPIDTSNKNTIPWGFTPYKYIRGVHFCIISPLKCLYIVLECGLKKLLNLLANIFDTCANLKSMHCFTIDFHGSHIPTHIELWIYCPLPSVGRGCSTPSICQCCPFLKKKVIILDVDILIVSVISHTEVWFCLGRAESSKFGIIWKCFMSPSHLFIQTINLSHMF